MVIRVVKEALWKHNPNTWSHFPAIHTKIRAISSRLEIGFKSIFKCCINQHVLARGMQTPLGDVIDGLWQILLQQFTGSLALAASLPLLPKATVPQAPSAEVAMWLHLCACPAHFVTFQRPELSSLRGQQVTLNPRFYGGKQGTNLNKELYAVETSYAILTCIFTVG